MYGVALVVVQLGAVLDTAFVVAVLDIAVPVAVAVVVLAVHVAAFVFAGAGAGAGAAVGLYAAVEHCSQCPRATALSQEGDDPRQICCRFLLFESFSLSTCSFRLYSHDWNS